MIHSEKLIVQIYMCLLMLCGNYILISAMLEEHPPSLPTREQLDAFKKIMERENELVKLVGQTGSLKGQQLLRYKEYHAYNELNLPIMPLFRQHYNKMNGEINKFFESFPELAEFSPQTFIEAIKARLPITQTQWRMIVESKRFMVILYGYRQPGCYLDILDFAENDRNRLGKIYALSRLHHPWLDKIIIDQMIATHQHNRAKALSPENNNSHWHRAIIEGGGPNGMIAAFQLFIAGMDVTLVNDRSGFARTHPIDIYQKQIVLLSYFLGTEFYLIFFGPNKMGDISQKDVAHLDMNTLEKAMHNALRKLESQAKKFYNNDESHLRLLESTKFERLEIMQSDNDSAPMHYGILKNLDTQLESQFPVDVLICAGGANDKIRDEYLAPPISLSHPRTYGKGTLWKPNLGERVFNFGIDGFEANLDEMGPFLQKQRFIDLFNSTPLVLDIFNGEFIKKFVEKLMEGELENNFDEDGIWIDPKLLSVSVIDDAHSQRITIVSAIPTVLKKLIQKITARKRDFQYDSDEFKLLTQFQSRITRKWITALLEYSYLKMSNNLEKENNELPFIINLDPIGDLGPNNVGGNDGPIRLNFDPHPVNTSIFETEIKALKEPVKIRAEPSGQSRMLIAAIGDANISQHYLLGQGISVGSLGVEIMHHLFNSYHNNQLTDEALAAALNKELRQTHSFVLKDVGKYLRMKGNFVAAIGANSSRAPGNRPINEPGSSSSSPFMAKKIGLGISGSSVKLRKRTFKISKRAKKTLSLTNIRIRKSNEEVATNFKRARDRIFSDTAVGSNDDNDNSKRPRKGVLDLDKEYTNLMLLFNFDSAKPAAGIDVEKINLERRMQFRLIAWNLAEKYDMPKEKKKLAENNSKEIVDMVKYACELWSKKALKEFLESQKIIFNNPERMEYESKKYLSTIY